MTRATQRLPCKVCGKTLGKQRVAYCSKACMAVAYRERMKGEANPHYSNAGAKTCEQCGAAYDNYNKASRFCSYACRSRSPENLERLKQMAKRPRPNRKKLGVRGICKHCHAEFRSPGRRFYCHNEECKEAGRMNRGGAGARVDANQPLVIVALEAAGAAVMNLSHVGRGVPDLIVSYGGVLHLMEVKNPDNSYGRNGLNERQTAWAAAWKGGPVHVVRGPGEALAVIGAPFTAQVREAIAKHTAKECRSILGVSGTKKLNRGRLVSSVKPAPELRCKGCGSPSTNGVCEECKAFGRGE